MKMRALFGAGQIAEKLLKDNINVGIIFDNNPELSNSSLRGIEIKTPTLSNLSDVTQIIICTTSIVEVQQQLEKLGFEGNITVAAPLKEHQLVSEIQNHKIKCLISSGLPSVSQTSGGGIYKITETDVVEVEKIYSGNTHGLIKLDHGLAFSSQGDGIVMMDDDLKVEKKIKLPAGLRPHGLQRSGECFFVACSSADKILKINDNGEIKAEYKMSDACENYGSAQHHCNDLCIIDNYAYVSMFSVSGNWKRGVFDGGIVKIDLQTGTQQILCRNLKMPHSVSNVNGYLQVLNSYTGEVLGYDFSVIGSLPGFVRGLDIKRDFLYVGESRNRNFSKLTGKQTFASIDSKITLINPETGICRSLHLPNSISEIHAIVAL